MKPNVKKGLLIGGAVIIVGGVAGIIAWFATRPRSLPISQAINPQSSLTLVKAGFLQQAANTTTEADIIDGHVQIDSSFLLENSTVITHYLTINAMVGFPRINITTGNFTNTSVDNVTTMMDLMVPTGPRIHLYFVQELEAMELTVPNYRIDTVNAKDFPFALSSDFDPQLWRGGILVQENDDNNGTEMILARVGFTVNLLESSNTTMSTTTTGHVSRLVGDGYSLGGTITLQYRNSFVDGNVVSRPVLLFTNISPPFAPGPYLYLTRRPMEKTHFIETTDLLIKITVGGNDGDFTVEGNFEQDWKFPQEDPVDYIEGSWIVWCDPFGVRLGYGSIRALSSQMI